MLRIIARMLLVLVTVGLLSSMARADSYPVGTLSLDTPTSINSGQFDITNLTGSNSLPPDFPVLTSLTFNVTSLTVDTSGGTVVLTASDFTRDSAGDLIGNIAFNLLTTTLFDATLVGTLSPTTGVNVSGVGTVTIQNSMTDGLGDASISLTDPSRFLVSGDVAAIFATMGAVSPVSEPSTLLLLGGGLFGLVSPRKCKRSRLAARTAIVKMF